MKILPKSRLGKWAVGLFVVFISLVIAGGMVSSLQGSRIEYPNPFNSPVLGTIIYLMFTAAITASIVGIIAIKKNNERSVLVYIAIPFGVAYFIGIIMLLIGAIIEPPGK